MKWEELIAEARAAGVLAFCSDGVAVLKRCDGAPPESSPATPREDRSQRRESGDGESESAH